MDFEWTVLKTFTDIPEREYINDCCFGCDEILNQIKPEIASAMKIDAEKITIYQEDWGWALEFSKDDIFYFLGLNNVGESENKTDFTVLFEATKKVKKFLFTKSVEATSELNEFIEIITNIAKKNGFEVNKTDEI